MEKQEKCKSERYIKNSDLKIRLCLQNKFLRYNGMVPMNSGVFPAIGILSTEAMQKE